MCFSGNSGDDSLYGRLCITDSTRACRGRSILEVERPNRGIREGKIRKVVKMCCAAALCHYGPRGVPQGPRKPPCSSNGLGQARLLDSTRSRISSSPELASRRSSPKRAPRRGPPPGGAARGPGPSRGPARGPQASVFGPGGAAQFSAKTNKKAPRSIVTESGFVNPQRLSFQRCADHQLIVFFEPPTRRTKQAWWPNKTVW